MADEGTFAADLARAIGPVARELLGEPNPRLSSAVELRFGTHGSLSVDLQKGVWRDHETGEDGGVLDLLRARGGLVNGAGVAWLEERNLIPRRQQTQGEKRSKTVVATYDYRNAEGAVLFQVVRYAPKDFRQRHPDPDRPGQWLWKMQGVQLVPYRLPALLEAIQSGEPVFVAEGEKACEALVSLGLAATCSPGGAGKWRPEFSPWLSGADVVVLPDNDDAGRKHAAQVVQALAGHARRIRVLELPGLPEKGDAHDWVAAGGTAEQLETLASPGPEPRQADPEPGSAQPAAGRQIGKLRILSVEDMLDAPARSYLLDGLIAPSELSVWWGRPKCGKSFLLLRIAYGLAQGRGMWGRDAEPIRVLYVAAEGESGVRGRIRALHDALGTAPSFHLIAQRVDLFDPEADLSDLLAATEAVGAQLVVIDTLARVMGAGDENKTPDMSALVGNFDRVREMPSRPHVAVVHHGGWEGNHARGSIALVGAADMVVKVDGEQGGPKTAVVEYAKDDAVEDPLGFKLDVVELGNDPKGRPRTTCLAVEKDVPAAAGERGASLSEEQRGWLRDLRNMFNEPDFAEWRTPEKDMNAALTLTREQVRAGFKRTGRIEANPDGTLTGKERERLRSMLNRLKDKGKIGMTQELVWLL